MAAALRLGAAEVRFTDRGDGDLSWQGGDRAAVERRRQAVAAGAWTWVRQVHGARVVVARSPGDGAGGEGDAAVTAVPGAVLAVLTADCAPVVLAGDGVVAVAHAGWRGVMAGVLEATVAAMRDAGAGGPVAAALGPCIHPECYEFGPADLDRVAARLGDEVRATTVEGRPALDLPAAVAAALAPAGVTPDRTHAVCTRCSPDHFSHRGGDAGRQASVVWLGIPETPGPRTARADLRR